MIKVGIISPVDERKCVREAGSENILRGEARLIERLCERGVEVVRGGEGLAREDQVVRSTGIMRQQIRAIAKQSPQVLILHQGDWTWPYDSRDAVQLFANELSGVEKGIARVLIYCNKAPQVPGLVAGMAVGGALRRVGIPYQLVFGDIESETTMSKIMACLNFFEKRAAVAQEVAEAIDRLHGQKYLAVGGMSLKMCTATADVDQWAKIFGISYDALDQSELTKRAQTMVDWEGKPGKSAALHINDTRVKEAYDFIYGGQHAQFLFNTDKFESIEIFLYQLCYYYAAVDVVAETDCDFMGIKCQDELSGFECTQCVTAAFLNNDIGPDGKPKGTIPVACENDMDSSLTQLLLKTLNGGKPAGFGDFRDIEDGSLAIVNCGQHPPYFFGKPDEDGIAKLKNTEFCGQDLYYLAGGATVRGRTPGGEIMTIARLHRENLRYSIVAMAVKTEQVDAALHEKYTLGWPIIMVKPPVDDTTVIDLWPCNHLGFTYGDYTPQIVELAERLGIGYTVYDADGNLYKSFS